MLLQVVFSLFPFWLSEFIRCVCVEVAEPPLHIRSPFPLSQSGVKKQTRAPISAPFMAPFPAFISASFRLQHSVLLGSLLLPPLLHLHRPSRLIFSRHWLLWRLTVPPPPSPTNQPSSSLSHVCVFVCVRFAFMYATCT